jgi:hypothetical protein
VKPAETEKPDATRRNLRVVVAHGLESCANTSSLPPSGLELLHHLTATRQLIAARRRIHTSSEANARLSRIEELLVSLTDRLQHEPNVDEGRCRTPKGLEDVGASHALLPGSSGHSLSTESPQQGLGLSTSNLELRLAIPALHSTAAEKILAWPCCPLSTSSTFDLRYPTMIEALREKDHAVEADRLISTPLRAMDISFGQARHLINNYLEWMYPHAPFIDQDLLQSSQLQVAIQSGFSGNLESCLVVMVFALGALVDMSQSPAPPISQVLPESRGPSPERLADDLRHHAAGLLAAHNGYNWLSVQCFLLMAQFYSARLKIVDHWNAVHQACTKIMLLLTIQDVIEPLHAQLYWVAYMHESQLLAEFDFPPSGISRLEYSVPLPYSDYSLREGSHLEYRFAFLAQIALRRLLNRIHRHLYKVRRNVAEDDRTIFTHQSDPVRGLVSSGASMLQELDRQLEGWRESLPAALHFSCEDAKSLSLEDSQFQTVRQRLLASLKARYCGAKTIIHRPILYKLLHCADAVDGVPLSDQDAAGQALCMALAVALHGGILRVPWCLLPHPINPCRRWAYVPSIAFWLISP